MRLAEDSEFGVRKAVAGNSSTPVEALMRLAEDSDSGVRKAVAGTSSTPVELLTRLAEDSDFGVRRAVAGNSLTPVELLTRLAEDSNSSVRAGVARNPSTPVEMLTQLADDPEDWVRRAVAGNPHTPVDVLARLAEDSEESVRVRVAGNLSTPVLLLMRLAEDPKYGVRWQVYHPAPGSSQLAALAAIGNENVRAGVAASVATPLEVLGGLASDQEASVRESVAGNLQSPAGVVADLASNDPCFPVRKRALLNPVCPNDVREASGLVFLFTIGENYCDGHSGTFPLSQHEIARDLVAVERFPTEVDDDLAAYEILRRILGEPDYDGGGYQERNGVLTWAGTGAPDWWSADWDWGQLGQLLSRSKSSFVEEALDRDIDALFNDAMGEPGDDEDENVEGWAITVAFSGRESSQQAWARVGEDIESAVGDSTEQLQGLADRWLARANGDERPELVMRFIEGALARNPASPPEVVRQMATADDAGLRWLVTRNPGANDEVKALAALSLSTDERFEQHVPDGDLQIRYASFSLGVMARIWPGDECPFIDELPYDSRTGYSDDISDAEWELFAGTGPGGVVYSFIGEFVDPDD